jgi:hypothetical protein
MRIIKRSLFRGGFGSGVVEVGDFFCVWLGLLESGSGFWCAGGIEVMKNSEVAKKI